MKSNQAGYLAKLSRIFIGVRRSLCPTLGELKTALTKETAVSFPCRFLGKWETFSGLVNRIATVPEGIVVSFRPSRGLLENWDEAVLWIPHAGTAGLISYDFKDLVTSLCQSGFRQNSDWEHQDRYSGARTLSFERS